MGICRANAAICCEADECFRLEHERKECGVYAGSRRQSKSLLTADPVKTGEGSAPQVRVPCGIENLPLAKHFVKCWWHITVCKITPTRNPETICIQVLDHQVPIESGGDRISFRFLRLLNDIAEPDVWPLRLLPKQSPVRAGSELRSYLWLRSMRDSS